MEVGARVTGLRHRFQPNACSIDPARLRPHRLLLSKWVNACQATGSGSYHQPGAVMFSGAQITSRYLHLVDPPGHSHSQCTRRSTLRLFGQSPLPQLRPAQHVQPSGFGQPPSAWWAAPASQRLVLDPPLGNRPPPGDKTCRTDPLDPTWHSSPALHRPTSSRRAGVLAVPRSAWRRRATVTPHAHAHTPDPLGQGTAALWVGSGQPTR